MDHKKMVGVTSSRPFKRWLASFSFQQFTSPSQSPSVLYHHFTTWCSTQRSLQAGHSKDYSLILASDSSQVRRSHPSCLTKLWLIGFIKHIESLPCVLKFDKIKWSRAKCIADRFNFHVHVYNALGHLNWH